MNYLRVYKSGDRHGSKTIRSPPLPDATTPTASTSAPVVVRETAPESSSSSPNGPDAASAASSRSRASSIFSTGTKTSINTLPPRPPHAESHTGPIDVVVGRRNFRITARPGSILSISSFDHPAPPYSEAVGANASQSTTTLTAVSLQSEGGDANESTTIEQPTPIAPAVQHPVLHDQAEEDESSEGQFHSQPSSRSHSPPSPPMSPLSSSTNAISAHYTAVVRTIDTNHRAELELIRQEHAAALAQTRNDIDAAYRIPFRQARNRAEACSAEAEANKQLVEECAEEIESLRVRNRAAEKELAELKTSSEKQIQALKEEIDGLKEVAEQMKVSGESSVLRARNEVEDVWEGRWRDRMRLAAEQVKGSWEDGRDTGWHEGMLQGCRNIEAIWGSTESRPLPPDLQDEIDKWKAEAEKRKR